METPESPDLQAPADLPLIEIIRDPETATAVLKPPRPAILAALREPDSASGLARRLGLARQRLNHHIRELQKASLLRLVEERRRRGCVERVVQATAQRYLLSPEILGDLDSLAPEDIQSLGDLGFSPLAALAGRMLQDLAILRDVFADEVPAITLLEQIRFSSPEAFTDFVRELSRGIHHLVAKYHDEAGTTAPHRFFVGAYPGAFS